MGRVISTCIQFIDAFTNPSKKTLESIRRMSKEAKAAGKQIQAAGGTISKAGSTLTKTITAPVAGVAAAAVKTAADYESAMSNVQAITGATGNDFKKLTQLGKDLGASTAWSAKECAEAMQYTGMAGWTAKENIDGLKGILDLASASGTDLARTSDIMTDAISAFGYKASDSAKFADTMTKACTSANVSVETLGESYKYCGAICGTMGYSIDEVTTSLAVMGNMDIKGSQAGTAIKNAISNMAAPTKNMKAAMDDLGISIVNQDGSMKSWGDVIKNLQGSFKGLTQDQQAAYAKQLFGKESMAGMLAIINTSTDDYNALADSIKNSGGAANDAAQTQLNNLNGQLTLLKSALEGAAITIGNKLLPYMKQAVSWVQKATNWFNSLSDAQVNQIMKWAGIAAAIGPALLVFGKVVSGIGKVVGVFSAVSGAIEKAGSVMALLTSPAAIVIGVLAAVALAAVVIIKNWSKIKPLVMQVKDWFVSTFGGPVKAAIQTFKVIFSNVAAAVVAIMPAIINAVKAVIPVVGKMLSSAFDFVGNTIKKVTPYIAKIAKTIGNTLGFAIKKLSPVVTKLAATFSAVFSSIFAIVSGVAKKLRPVFNVIGSVISVVMKTIQKSVSTSFSIVTNVISTAAKSIKQIIGGITKVFSGILDFITGIFTGNWRKAWTGVKEIFSGIFQTFAGIAKAPINAVIGIINGAIGALNKINVKIPDWVPGLGGKNFGINIPKIPALATGTQNWKGGLAQINEKGGEIVDLPRGSRVYPHDKSLSMARKDGAKQAARKEKPRKGSVKIVVAKLADQIIVREESDIDKIAEKLANKLRDTAKNMGVC